MSAQRPMHRRRTFVAALSAAALATALPLSAVAQDPRASLAQAAARSWLAIVDKGDADTAWKAASETFRARSTVDQWKKALPTSRQPLGALQSRTLLNTQFGTKLQALPEGEYAMLLFRTAFAARTIGETVVLAKERDGVWRVVGYQIR